MLQIQNICKKYVTGDLVQTALDQVSLTLREHELVAILGPSGSGKSTLLNIIGGLDRYDSGDLIIDGISTRKYSGRDWDSYRNHSVGFVFQSYNLIPHQTVLSNVELALTISGVSRSQRRRRAVQALEDVGLGDQLHKKPNQMSGGQMQRVAIARALVNNPRILLADEPTGALDSDTSLQIMELLREVSKDRLVVMVTHNPELADTYADRIVRVRDGRVTDDTNPCPAGASETAGCKNMGRASMSFFTALALSFNNLKTKKGRTLLTAFAGSIGIIGIALILSLSAGFQHYVDQVQENTLANYPLTIQSESADMTSAFVSMMTYSPKEDQADRSDSVAEQRMLSKMFADIGANDLGSFKAYLEAHYKEIQHAISAVQYRYSVKPRVYADSQKEILQVNPATMCEKIFGSSMISSYMQMDAFQEMVQQQSLLETQYDVLQGRWPQSPDELVFVLPEPGRLPDYTAYILGLKNMDALDQMMELVLNGKEYTQEGPPQQWTYDTLMDLRFRLVSPADLYQYNADYGIWEDMSGDPDYMSRKIQEGRLLQVVGIICPKDGAGSTSLYSGIAYLPSLTTQIMEEAAETAIVQQQLAAPQTDVFSGAEFKEAAQTPELDFEDMVSIDKDVISSAFGSTMNEKSVSRLLKDYIRRLTAALHVDTTEAQKEFIGTLSDFGTSMLSSYAAEHADAEGLVNLPLEHTEALIDSFLQSEYAADRLNALTQRYSVSADIFLQVYKPLLAGLVSTCIPLPQVTLPQEALQDFPAPELPRAEYTADRIPSIVEAYAGHPAVAGTASVMGAKMMEADAMEMLSDRIAGFGQELAKYVGNSLYVDQDKLQNAFRFNMDEAQLKRIFEAMSGKQQQRTAQSNLSFLGYADPASPASMSIYMADFSAKEEFLAFLDEYNQKMANLDREEQVIHYTDMTGMMMKSVRTIIDSVSYVLIAFVGVSLIVSSIMIGIITYISVMERTREIGVLRAMGASRHNISQVFNAETLIIGLCSGILGIGITLLILIPGNRLIYSLTQNPEIAARLPAGAAAILILLSMVLTLLGGLIPSSQAARKDPVVALRSE